MIEVNGLYKRFGPVRAVNGLSFQAPDGAITGLLGSNGAGKTTTLRIVGGVLHPDEGSVHVTGSVGALLDHVGLYPRLTARENVDYFGRLRGIPERRLRACADELFSRLGMQSLAGRPTKGFSQGERMKTALARAVIHEPANLLLDEPTNGLDVPTIRSLRAFLKRMRDAGACIVFSSHVLEEVRALCDNVVIVSQGSLAAQGSPDRLCRETNSDNLEDAFVKVTTC
jgi:sodium transport system ATP-binding protein